MSKLERLTELNKSIGMWTTTVERYRVALRLAERMLAQRKREREALLNNQMEMFHDAACPTEGCRRN